MSSDPWLAPPPAKYVVTTKLVRQDGDANMDDDDLVPYLINDELLKCVRAAPPPCNQERRLVERTED